MNASWIQKHRGHIIFQRNYAEYGYHDYDSDYRPPHLGSRPPRTNAVPPSNHHSHNHNPSPLRNNISNNNNNNEHEAEEEKDEEEKHDTAVAEAETVQKPSNLRQRKRRRRRLLVELRGTRMAKEWRCEERGRELKSMRMRGMVGTREGQYSSEKRKFWIALSRNEIEEDIFIMIGSLTEEEEEAAATAAWVAVALGLRSHWLFKSYASYIFSY
ncbi:hypothetical protein PIB30_012015 [Stylosanthes scabra]|uniref:Uncharacterized protein n=1 Tax=Stylosanthes scabra TaxID=79078 RepID=A0ABU6Y4T6_9FABA|nr:hypothetical protein [Stylosanthes scabra]